jgi:hypothetical protein
MPFRVSLRCVSSIQRFLQKLCCILRTYKCVYEVHVSVKEFFIRLLFYFVVFHILPRHVHCTVFWSGTSSHSQDVHKKISVREGKDENAIFAEMEKVFHNIHLLHLINFVRNKFVCFALKNLHGMSPSLCDSR